MTKQKEYFSFNVLLELPEQWMMGVTSLKVCDTVYNIAPINNKIEILLTEQQLKSYKHKKLTRNDFDQLKTVVEAFSQQPTNKDQQNSIIIL